MPANTEISLIGTDFAFHSSRYHDMKDPCPVVDETIFHLYGSGGKSGDEIWKILHATAPSVDGPWEDQIPCELEGVTGDHVAAPGVFRDVGEQLFHMFVQNEFMALGGSVMHLTSVDGHKFKLLDVPLSSIDGSEEAGIYDPHPSEINGEKYIVYSGSGSFEFTGTYHIGKPNIFLAKSRSGSWYGPWDRLGKILDHSEVPHHNQLTDPDYEWGLEGPQLIGLPEGKVMLMAVLFLRNEQRGRRQRVFWALADSPAGPYKVMGPLINPSVVGETGHAAAFLSGDTLEIFYQERGENSPWRYRRTSIPVHSLLSATKNRF